MWQDSGRPSQVGSLYRSAIGVMHISMFSPRGWGGGGGERGGGGGAGITAGNYINMKK